MYTSSSPLLDERVFGDDVTSSRVYYYYYTITLLLLLLLPSNVVVGVVTRHIMALHPFQPQVAHYHRFTDDIHPSIHPPSTNESSSFSTYQLKTQNRSPIHSIQHLSSPRSPTCIPTSLARRMGSLGVVGLFARVAGGAPAAPKEPTNPSFSLFPPTTCLPRAFCIEFC